MPSKNIMRNEWTKLKPARLAARVRQTELAAAVGYSSMTISRFETGKQPANAETVERILRTIEAVAANRTGKV